MATEVLNAAAIGEYAQARARGWSERTARERRYQLQLVADELAPTALVLASAEDVQAALRGSLLAAVRESTVQGYVVALRGFFRWSQVHGLRTDDPMAQDGRGQRA